MKTLVDLNEIPIIDLGLSEIVENHSETLIKRLANELDSAFSRLGIAFLINHGISEEKFIAGSNVFQEFCRLDDQIKDKYLCKKNHGYVKPGAERFNRSIHEIRHSFNFCTTNATEIPSSAEIPNFHETSVDLLRDLNNLQLLILKALSIALDVPAEYFINNHTFLDENGTFGTSVMRYLYYPPVSNDVDTMDLNQTRCGAHFDYGTFTLLSQDSEGGLEIKNPKTNEWHRVGFLPGAILLNTGELLDIWSDNRYPALWHRVVIPKEKDVRNRPRNARALFVHCKQDVLVGPIKLLVDPSNLVNHKFKTFQQMLEDKLIGTYGKEYGILEGK